VTPEPLKTNTVAPFRQKPVAVPVAVQVADDPTLEFAVESAPATVRASFNVPKVVAALAGLLVLLVVGVSVWGLRQTSTSAATGSVRVESDPSGAEVRIDGAVRGTTPLALALPIGHYSMSVRQGGRVKDLPVDVASGEGRAYLISWAESAPVTATVQTGSLNVASDVQGSTVSVDGAERGRAPLTLSDLSVGRHEVIVRSGTTTHRRSVEIEAGATASLVISSVSGSATWGWITLAAPFAVQALEDGRVIGTSEIDRIMLPPGDHDLQLVSEPFGFRQASRVKITAGRGGPVVLTVPKVGVNINALPWAEVAVDGTRVGDTPLANVMLPLGDHELVFRHPQLGEKRQMARVTAQSSLRISVDMRAR